MVRGPICIAILLFSILYGIGTTTFMMYDIGIIHSNYHIMLFVFSTKDLS